MKQTRRDGKLQLLEGAVIAEERGNGTCPPFDEDSMRET